MDGGEGYREAGAGAALAAGEDRAWLEVRGPDAPDFLQRVLSSDLAKLGDGEGQWSALLDGDGRWIADLLLFRLPGAGEPLYGLDAPREAAAALRERLDRLHFGERLRLGPLAPQPARLLLLGPEGERLLRERGLPVPPDRAGFGCVALEGGGFALRRPDRGAACLDLATDEARAAELRAELLRSGAAPCSAAALETLRLEAFVPRWGADFDSAVSLPQSGEWRRVSVTKGCYAGQEVVARIHTYGEAPRQLCRLRFESAEPMLGADLMDGSGKVLGAVSSWAFSPRSGRGVGLGTVRRKAAASGTRLVARLGAASVGALVEVPEKVLG